MVMNDEDKDAIASKMIWEGGLEGYISYGIDEKLYDEFKDEFDVYIDIVNNDKKLPKKKFKEFEIKVVKFLNADDYISEINKPTGMFGCRQIIWNKDKNKKDKLISDLYMTLGKTLSENNKKKVK